MSRLSRAAAFVLLAALAAPAAAQDLVLDDQARQDSLFHYRIGSELLSAERFEEAAEEFQQAIDIDPLMTLAHYGQGQAYMNLQRFASAILAFERCRDAYRELAGMAVAFNADVDRRREDEVRELRETISAVRTGRLKSNQPENAVLRLESRIRDLQNMQGRNLQVAPVPAEVSLSLGSAYFRNGRAEDAEREWLEAARTNPGLGEAHNNLAAIYLITGRKQMAQEAVEAAERTGLRVNPLMKEDIARLPDEAR